MSRRGASDGVGEVPPVGVEIETQNGCSDDLDIEVGQRQPRCGADAFQAPAHDVQGVLGDEQQHTAGA